MTIEDVIEIFDKLIKLPTETEYIEFKEAKNNFDFEDLGKYFSAISNEANLKKQECGWIVFGVTDKPPRKIIGTNYKIGSKLQKLKEDISNHTTGKITFDEIYEIEMEGKRILVFKILPSPQNMPVAWKGFYYGRDNEALGALNIQEIEEIRNQGKLIDWSVEIVSGATIEDLDENAIKKAREKYILKNPKKSEEVRNWDDFEFLNKAKITINGKITRTALILLGKSEAEHYLNPANVKISWILRDENGIEMDYEHFNIPFLVNIEEIFKKIRNLKYRYMPNGTLFPMEINQYDAYVMREALNNCIAHQDYSIGGKINLVEKKDELIFTNLGTFLPKSIENVLESKSPPEYYRNPFLTNAMVNLDMIDTIGSGIKKMIIEQKKRFFPLPDFDLSDNKVQVKIIGKILDENYTNLLINEPSLDIFTVYLLDKVQKKEKIAKENSDKLRELKLVEGRYPNIFISSKVAKIIGDKEKYIKNRGFDKDYYKKMIISYIKEFGEATRQELNVLLYDKLSSILTEKQKDNKVRNLLQEMKRDEIIYNAGNFKVPTWKLKN